MSVTDWQLDTKTLRTVRDFVRFGASQMANADIYFGHGTDNAWDEAVFLTLETLHLPYSLLDQIMEAALTESERATLLQHFDTRIRDRVPAAYLVGKAWFAGLPFIINENVLVPRSPIAELIEKQFSPWLLEPPQKILDLCCGSGCIGIAAATVFPEALVDLADISPEAVDVAWQNIDLHGMDERVQAIESDLFSDLQEEVYDLILCNPPYVDAEDMATMPEEYQREPALGLESGTDGLDFTRRLLVEARDHLTDNGLLVCEVGNSCYALEEAYPEVAFTWVDFEKGGHGVFIMTATELDALLDYDV
ncbi:50S ribosomal protein L3 N(5)-glutamine methyltransferase [Halioxenophilus sp. WMMB6]|uniref:50S ribosomal protein L3 N(5)-glutamine methyltransferase n=1 Tax=Halioxenophilus sp. WMMB6 TaxID=3073815 RepID=UPI00295ECA31|nr:50S ribosomal protein L3 N(5)-glutamine methyltransferase [Halioxenophilus sp. WMMB6]